MTYSQLHCHTYYSIDGLSSPEIITKRCKELGIKACAITDHGNLAGVPDFISECKKQEIKPILGTELYISNYDATNKTAENRKLHHLVVLAKNLDGWKNLIKAVSRSNDKDVYYYKPRLDYTLLKNYSKNLIGISGHPGSLLFNVLFIGNAYDKSTPEEVQSLLINNPVEEAIETIKFYKSIFDDFFIEINLFDRQQYPCQAIVAEILREAGEKTNTKCIAITDSHYARPEDTDDHRIIICSMLQTTLKKAKKGIEEDDFGLKSFFKSNKHYIPPVEELVNTVEEIENTNYVADLCETYNIFNKPKLPKFIEDEHKVLISMCEEGFDDKKKPEWNIDVYLARMNQELNVIKDANLAGYFLIVQDYINYAKLLGYLVGPARGSAAGSLVAYLIGITEVDPIQHKLIFERFYNSGRNTKDNIEYPDIDVDFPIEAREEVFQYLCEKYGDNSVAQIATYGRLLGSGALKEVLRIHDACSFSEMNEITKAFPQEASIMDELDQMSVYSIILWTLQNEPQKLQGYCRLENDKLVGDYAQYFEQAIRLEGVIKTQGKHAAGVIIAPDNLNDYCPMIYDKHGDKKIIGWDMDGAQKVGYLKMDLLGVAGLSKLQYINKLLNKRKKNEVHNV